MKAAATPEFELLLRCARTHLGDTDIAAISRLTALDLDWEAFVGLSQRHGVHPLAYRTLAGCRSARIPPRILERLRSLYESNRFRNLVLTADLIKALGALRASGIFAVAQKGPTLAAALYSDIALRVSGDIDIRIRPRDAVKARHVLIAEGYAPYRNVPQFAVRWYASAHYEFAFHPANRRGPDIELHTRDAPWYFRLPQVPDAAWERTVAVPMAGSDVPMFAPADLLLDLCIHGCRHKWGLLKWIVDVAEFLRVHSQLDWSAVMENAHRVRAQRIVALGMRLAHDLLDAGLAPEVQGLMARKSELGAFSDEVRGELMVPTGKLGGEDHTLPFIARVAEGRDAQVLCRALVLPYFVLQRVVRPGMDAAKRAVRR